MFLIQLHELPLNVTNAFNKLGISTLNTFKITVIIKILILFHIILENLFEIVVEKHARETIYSIDCLGGALGFDS